MEVVLDIGIVIVTIAGVQAISWSNQQENLACW
jgi:hypothetical protein